MKKLVFFFLGVVVLGISWIGCRQTMTKVFFGEKFSIKGPPFITEVMLKTTPVKNQGRSELCWAYAMLATIETEHLMRGDSVNLSPDYVGRMWLAEQARFYYLSRGRHAISMRGMSSMLLRLIERYGVEPYDAYHNYDGVNYRVLSRTAMQIARASVSLDMMNTRLNDALDHSIGYLPRVLFMLGAEYTPLEFAHSVCLPDEYVALTSFSHHPFGQKFVLETPDNQLRDSFINIPVDNLMQRVEQAIRHGHPVCWEGDISEPGFSVEQGRAELPNENRPVTQTSRQHDFETFRTTDDHCMELCGIAHLAGGRKYFIAKNSWGKRRPYAGFMYLSFNYVKAKTIAVYLPAKS